MSIPAGRKGTVSFASIVSVAIVAAALAILVAINWGATPAAAVTTTIGAAKDNTLYEDPTGSTSNGAGSYIFVGRTNEATVRRGLIAFDIASAVPPGATITGVTLTLRMSRTQAGTESIALRRLLSNWGEGTSNADAQEGKGAPATTNDATWLHTFYDTAFWATPGGDFSATVSASTPVAGNGTYSWNSAQMVADVQAWLDSPGTDFGWLLIGNEAVNKTAKRFDSKEHGTANRRPALTIVYETGEPTPPVSPTPSPTPGPTPSPTPIAFDTPLYFPPVITDANPTASIEEACLEILPGQCTNLWTYGGTFPGVTFRRPTGEPTAITFINNLPPEAGEMTVHNHGAHASPENDGRPNEYLIPPGGSRTYTYEHMEDGYPERGATQFYHDHRQDLTARNVWMGLAGFYILDDPDDPDTLPSGEFDVPLAIADRQFDENNQIPYEFNQNGVFGDHILVNGVYQPYHEVGDRKYRFRILNASNARIYNLVLSSGQEFLQIGTESGLLPVPVSRTEMRLGPAERADVVVDFAGRLGQEIYVTDTRSGEDLLQLRVTQALSDDSFVPQTLRPLPDIGEPVLTREFDFGFTDGHWTINGLRHDHHRIDAYPVLGTTEKWVLRNTGGAPHTIHLHNVDQICVSRNGGPCHPYETMKETWFLDGFETIEVKLKFSDHTGRYVFHCHMLEHEDDGMMAEFEVVTPEPTPTPSPTPTPTPAPCPPMPWPVPPGDSDCDGWTDQEEEWIGTDPFSACGPNAWPPDIDNNGVVNINDVGELLPPIFGSSYPFPDPGHPLARLDVDPNGVININDVGRLLPPVFGRVCTP